MFPMNRVYKYMLPLYSWQIPVSHVMIHLYTFLFIFFAYIRTSILMYHKVGLELRFVSLFVQLLKEVGFFFFFPKKYCHMM